MIEDLDLRTRNASESDSLGRFAVGLVGIWSLPVLRFPLVRWSFFLLVVFACLIRAQIGLAGTQIFSHDVFMVLDGAWRMFNGQIPHADFYSHLGLLTYAPTALAFPLSQNHGEAFAYAHAAVALLCGIWAYCLGKNRLSDTARVLMCLSVVLMVADPSALGFSPLRVAPAMTYNRVGYVLVGLAMTESFSRIRTGRGSDWRGGLSTGAVLSCALFLKITYFLAAVILLLAFIPRKRQTKDRWAGIVFGFVGLSILFCAYLRFHLGAMFRDLLFVAGAKHIKPNIYLVDGILLIAAMVLIFALAATLLLSERRAAGDNSILIAASGVCLVGGALLFGNYELYGFPLAGFFSILVVDTVNTQLSGRIQNTPDLFRASVLLFGTVFIAIPLISGTIGLGNGMVQKYVKARQYTPVNAPWMHGFVPVGDEGWYSGYVNDGLKLLTKFRHPGETVMSLDFTNPFSYTLGLKPAPGGATVLQYRTTFNDRYHQSAEVLFGCADLVMLPRNYSDTTLPESIPRLYGHYLESHYQRVAESNDWRLYRRLPGMR